MNVRKALTLAVLAAATTVTAAAQELAGLAHVAFHVSDVAKSRAFYEKLGIQQAFFFDKDGIVNQAFLKVNDTQFIELYPATGADTPGYMHLCFDSDALDTLSAQYTRAGLNPSPTKKGRAGNILFGLVGPEKENIEYSQYLPGSLHSNDKGKHLPTHPVVEGILSTAVPMQDPAAAEAWYETNLHFPNPTGPTRQLRIPGPSGQYVSFKPANGSQPDVIFRVKSLPVAVRDLTEAGIKVSVADGLATVQDPDGITLGFRAKF